MKQWRCFLGADREVVGEDIGSRGRYFSVMENKPNTGKKIQHNLGKRANIVYFYCPAQLIQN